MAVLRGHLALAQLDHRRDHLVHALVGRGIEDLQTFDVKAALGRSRLHGFDVADENGGQEAVLLQAGGRFEDARVGALGVDDLARIGFQNFNQIFKHNIVLRYR